MNGATAVPSVRKIKNPNRNRKIIIGASHHFFLSDKKSQNSLKIDNLDIPFLFLIKTVSHSLDSIHMLYRDYSNMISDFLTSNLKNLFQLIL